MGEMNKLKFLRRHWKLDDPEVPSSAIGVTMMEGGFRAAWRRDWWECREHGVVEVTRFEGAGWVCNQCLYDQFAGSKTDDRGVPEAW